MISIAILMTLEVLELVLLSGLLIEYDFWTHVPSDISVEQKFLPSSSFYMQTCQNNIQQWSQSNQVKINETKSKYIVFSRCRTKFTTRLSLNNYINQEKTIKLLELWISKKSILAN